MARRQVTELTTTVREEEKEETPILEEEKVDEFEAEYDEVAATVSFKLLDGTDVIIKEPGTRQILLLEGFIKSHDEEYRTDTFIMLAIASYSIIKFGVRKNIKFDELIDQLQLDDIQRVAAAIGYFRDFFSKFEQWANNKGSR